MEKFDYIICNSPPLFLGITAYLLKKIKGAKLIFNVSDLWPESAEKLGLVTNKIFLRSATKLEEFLYKRSDLIVGQSQGICKNISERFPNKKVYWFPNSADLNYYNLNNNRSDWRNENIFEKDDFLILYAGLMGHAQGLEVIIRAAEKLKSYTQIKFVLLGAGPEKEKLLALKKELLTDQVLFFDTVARKEMYAILMAVDVSIIPLKKLDLFKGVIPSKIFGSLALKKAILLGVEGEAKELFIEEGKCGLAFIPEDDLDLKNKVLELYNNRQQLDQFGKNGYRYIYQKFNCDEIVEKFYEQMINL